MTKITDNYTEKNTKNEFCTRETVPLQSKSLHSLVLCDTELPDQLPQSQTSKFQRMDPERISRGLVLLEPKFSNITPSRPFASEMIPLGKECLRKKTL